MAEVAVAVATPAGPTVNDENTVPSTGDEIKTVFHDVNNFNVKHPLLNSWSLWVRRIDAVRDPC
jgi:translation initiation factor 4E